MTIHHTAFARAGLLGNPSDIYNGKTVSITFRNFFASVELKPNKTITIFPSKGDQFIYEDLDQLTQSINRTGYYGGSRLVLATIKRFADYCRKEGKELSAANFSISYQTSIPRQVGLAGSSAIITATLRALMTQFKVSIPIEIQPNIILSAEMDELGIRAGLQDRVAQVYEGCVFMDFNPELLRSRGYGTYHRLTRKIPRLYIAYKADLSKVSGAQFNTLQSRYDKGEKAVVTAINEIADLADQGQGAIVDGDWSTLSSLINRNFDLRRQLMDISASNLKLVDTARSCGASAKFSGSGGSIIGMYPTEAAFQNLEKAMGRIGARLIRPDLTPRRPD